MTYGREAYCPGHVGPFVLALTRYARRAHLAGGQPPGLHRLLQKFHPQVHLWVMPRASIGPYVGRMATPRTKWGCACKRLPAERIRDKHWQ